MTNKRPLPLTPKQIEHDIADSFKYPKKMTKAEYAKLSLASIIAAVLLFAVYFLPQVDLDTSMRITLYVILAVFAACLITAVCELLLRRHRRKNVRMDDYEVTTETISHTEEESYRQTGGTSVARHSETVTNYTLYFENGKSWRITAMNFTWSAEWQMSDFSLYNSTDRGDTFIVVSEKRTGNIAVAYPTKLFSLR